MDELVSAVTLPHARAECGDASTHTVLTCSVLDMGRAVVSKEAATPTKWTHRKAVKPNNGNSDPAHESNLNVLAALSPSVLKLHFNFEQLGGFDNVIACLGDACEPEKVVMPVLIENLSSSEQKWMVGLGVVNHGQWEASQFVCLDALGFGFGCVETDLQACVVLRSKAGGLIDFFGVDTQVNVVGGCF